VKCVISKPFSIVGLLSVTFQALDFSSNMKEVLIHAGASGVGIAAIQLSRFNGAYTVTATATTKEKLDSLLAMRNGATHVAITKRRIYISSKSLL